MKATNILLLAALSGFCAVNSAFAQTWTQTSAPTNNLLWASIASSADGKQIVAVADTPNYPYNGPIYISADSGSTWVSNTFFTKPWNAIASSADGAKLAGATSVIYSSTNSGTSWQYSPITGNCKSVASSADGTKLVVVVPNGGIYTSTNSGGSWSLAANTSGKNWESVASSADGSKLVAAALNDSIYTSTDSGITWTSNSLPETTWVAVASSADGNNLAAAAGGFNLRIGTIYVSTNSGSTWTNSNAPILPWTALASSTDGSKLIATASRNHTNSIFTSTDYGFTWKSNNVAAANWSSVASSADGTKLVAATLYAGIWISQTTPSPILNVTPTNGNLGVSWVVPSTNFVLQQSADLSGWTDLTNTPVLNLTNLQNQISLPMPGSNIFYRLKTP